MRVERSLLAWEWLRRDPGYRSAAARALAGAGRPGDSLEATRAADWGLHAFEDPDRGAPSARPVWTRQVLPQVLEAEIDPSAPLSERVDLFDLGTEASLVRGGGREHILISDGRAALRLDLKDGTARGGPIGLRYVLAGTAVRPALGTLGRLVALLEGRAPRPEIEGRQRRARAVALLRTADAIAAGATQREIAEALFGEGFSPERWRVNSPSLRSRVQRLVRDARAIQRGGWRDLLA